MLSAWIRGSPDHVFGLGRRLDKHTYTDIHKDAHSTDIKRGLTWDINYFLVHVQEGGLCFFTSFTQRIDLQGGKGKIIVNCQLHHLIYTAKAGPLISQ